MDEYFKMKTAAKLEEADMRVAAVVGAVFAATVLRLLASFSHMCLRACMPVCVLCLCGTQDAQKAMIRKQREEAKKRSEMERAELTAGFEKIKAATASGRSLETLDLPPQLAECELRTQGRCAVQPVVCLPCFVRCSPSEAHGHVCVDGCELQVPGWLAVTRRAAAHRVGQPPQQTQAQTEASQVPGCEAQGCGKRPAQHAARRPAVDAGRAAVAGVVAVGQTAHSAAAAVRAAVVQQNAACVADGDQVQGQVQARVQARIQAQNSGGRRGGAIKALFVCTQRRRRVDFVFCCRQADTRGVHPCAAAPTHAGAHGRAAGGEGGGSKAGKAAAAGAVGQGPRPAGPRVQQRAAGRQRAHHAHDGGTRGYRVCEAEAAGVDGAGGGAAHDGVNGTLGQCVCVCVCAFLCDCFFVFLVCACFGQVRKYVWVCGRV